LPMPSGPPPGVPRTYPPGAMQPVPSQPPVPSHPPGPMPMPPMQTPAAYAMSGAPPKKSSKAPLVVALVVLLLAGGGAAAFFATRGKSEAGSGGSTGSGDPDDPWAGSGGGGGGGGGGGAEQDDDGPDVPTPPAPAAWNEYTDPTTGRGLELPPGVSTSPTMANGAVNFTGYRDGAMIIVGAFAAPNQGNVPSRAELDQFANQLASQLSARITESGYAQTQGESRYRIVMETAVDRGEARFYIEPHIIVLAYYTRNNGWDASAAERRQFFEGVSLPGGGGM
jgi:hypothetical protein